MMGKKRIIWTLKDQKGVNLAELMAVIAIIGIVAAIAVPVYVTYLPFLQIRSAARDLLSDFKYTQQLAVTKNQNHRLQFRSATVYDIECESCEGLVVDADGDSWEEIKTVNLGANYGNITRTSATTTIVFEPDGGTPAGGDVTFTLIYGDPDDPLHSRTITVNQLGRVSSE